MCKIKRNKKEKKKIAKELENENRKEKLQKFFIINVFQTAENYNIGSHSITVMWPVFKGYNCLGSYLSGIKIN